MQPDPFRETSRHVAIRTTACVRAGKNLPAVSKISWAQFRLWATFPYYQVSGNSTASRHWATSSTFSRW